MHILDEVAKGSFAEPVAIAFFISTTSSSGEGPLLFGLSGVDEDIAEEIRGSSGLFGDYVQVGGAVRYTIGADSGVVLISKTSNE